jgi:hypothetical protein
MTDAVKEMTVLVSKAFMTEATKIQTTIAFCPLTSQHASLRISAMEMQLGLSRLFAVL